MTTEKSELKTFLRNLKALMKDFVLAQKQALIDEKQFAKERFYDCASRAQGSQDTYENVLFALEEFCTVVEASLKTGEKK